MTRILLYGLLALLICKNTVCSAQNLEDRYGANILINPSFEDGKSGWKISREFADVDSFSQDGKMSLICVNRDRNSSQVVTQELHDVADKTIYIGAWVAANHLEQLSIAGDRGAFFYVEAYDNHGQYVGGTFRQGLIGTFDWRYIEQTYHFPSNTAKAIFGVGLRKGTVGTAWFDNLTVRAEQNDYTPIGVHLLYPNYRGITTTANHEPWTVLVESRVPFDWPSPEIRSTLTDASGKVLKAEIIPLSINTTEEIPLTFEPKTELQEGEYQWTVALKSKGRPDRQYDFTIHVRKKMPAIYIDREGFTVVDGKRFFPFGVYLGGNWSATDQDLARISQAGFNTVLSYESGIGQETEDYLNRAQAHGLRVIYSLKDMYHQDEENSTDLPAQHVKRWFQNPALLAWYINDELGPHYLPKLQDMYYKVCNLDGQHPAYQVVVKYSDVNAYLPATDVLGTDPYPISGINARPIRYVGNLTHNTVDESKGIKGTWQVLQIFDNSVYVAKEPVLPPTLDEMRNMSYQAIINGAKGILYYSYFDLYFKDYHRDPAFANDTAFHKRWPAIQQLAKELIPLIPVILKDRKINLIAGLHRFVQYQGWEDNDHLYLVVANTDQHANLLSVQIPDGWRLEKAHLIGISALLNKGNLNIRFEPQASGVVVLKK